MLKTFLTSLKDALISDKLISSGDKVVVAVSGGVDSVALLLGLNELSESLGIKLAVAHLNHAIRAATADADAVFVENLCQKLKLPFYGEKVDVPDLSKNSGISIEMAARECRYKFFVRVAEDFGTKIVATAHTSDDQAETVLLKLARGAGIDGLGGIAVKSEQMGLCIIRPLLRFYKKELVEFLEGIGQEWREDETNNDVSFLRNRVRHELLPWLADNLNSSIKETLCRTADILRNESDWLDNLCHKLVLKYSDSSGMLDATGVRSKPVAARRRILRLWLSAAGIDAAYMDYNLIQRADELLCRDNAGSCSMQLPRGYLLIRQYDKLLIEEAEDNIAPDSFCVEIKPPGEIIITELSLRITTIIESGVIKKKTGRAGNLPATVSISLAAIGDNTLTIRSWRSGDRMKPLGMKGTQKLQDIFVNEKVPVKERSRIPVVECAGEIVWIPNFRIAQGWEVLSDTEPSIHLSIECI